MSDHDLTTVDLLTRYRKGRRLVLPDCPTIESRAALLYAILWPETHTGGHLGAEPYAYALPPSREFNFERKAGTGSNGHVNGSKGHLDQLLLVQLCLWDEVER